MPSTTGDDRPPLTLQQHVPAMGGNAHLTAVVPAPQPHNGQRLLDAAQRALEAGAERLRQLEELWSRFRPESEISLLNAAGGRPVAVTAETRLLVSWCIAAWRRSGGLFDPTILPALEGLGYDRTFELVAAGPHGPAPADPVPVDPVDPVDLADLAPATAAKRAPGCGDVLIDELAGTVTLPAGVRLDPGGIGKGLAADLVAQAMISAGAAGACANLAGDVRASGLSPDGAGQRWLIGVEDPLDPGGALAMVQLPDGGGAVASSSVLVRRWGKDSHHVIDPSDGRPSRSEVVAVTVEADEAAWADAATKIALVAATRTEAVALLDRLAVAALLVLRDGTVVPTARALSGQLPVGAGTFGAGAFGAGALGAGAFGS